jgi:hypothetical protein
MKKILSLLTMLVVVASCLVVASAQTKKRKPQSPKGAIGAGGAGTYVRNGQRGRYVTRNGKRIWVPQGSPAVGNRRGVFEKDQIPVANKPPTNRSVVEREQLDAVKKNKSTNTNRP